MTHAERLAAEQIADAIAAIEDAAILCHLAGCDGYVVTNGLRQAITELRDVKLAVEGKL